MKKTILIIDDDATFRNAMGKILEASGYNVLLAKEGIEGYEMFMEDYPDLLLVDLLMPKLNGAELIKKIRGQEAGEKIPVIMMTGVMASGVLERDAKIKWGVDAFLAKGIDIEMVLKKVEGFIGPGEPASANR